MPDSIHSGDPASTDDGEPALILQLPTAANAETVESPHEAASVEVADADAAVNANDVSCAACGASAPRDSSYCPACGSALKAGAGSDDATPESDTGGSEPSSLARRPAWRRRRVIVPTAGVLVVTAVVAAALMLRGGGSGYDVNSALLTTNNTAAQLMPSLLHDVSFADLTASAKAAAVAETQLVAKQKELEGVANKKKRASAVAAVASQLAGVRAVKSLASLDPTAPTSWVQPADDLEKASQSASTAEADLKSNHLPANAQLPTAMHDASAQLRVTLTGMRDKLTAWQAETARVNADRSAQQKALDDYTQAFQPLVDRYSSLRSQLSDFVDKVTTSGGLFSDLYAFFGGASTSRQELRTAMGAVTPPAALVASHTTILRITDDSIRAIQSGITGASQYQFNRAYYFSITATPGWQDFSSMSSRITSDYTAALASWQKAIADEKARIAAIPTPPQPSL